MNSLQFKYAFFCGEKLVTEYLKLERCSTNGDVRAITYISVNYFTCQNAQIGAEIVATWYETSTMADDVTRRSDQNG